MSNSFTSILNYFQELFTERLPFFPSNIKASLVLIIFCLIAFSEQYLFIVFRRLSQHFQKKRHTKWKTKVTEMLTHIIIYGDEEETEELISNLLPTFLKIPFKNYFVRKILTKELLTYHANFTGKTQEVLWELYKRLNLEKFAKRELHSNLWEKQIEAIRELTQMSVRDQAANILKYTDDENGQLRMEAQAAYIKLTEKDQFKFLDTVKERILDWHQLVLYDVITKSKNITVPSFSKWLDSRNDTVVILCLKLINHYQQLDSIYKLIGLLNHKNLTIRSLTIKVLAKMEAEMAEKDLFSIYNSQSLEIQLDILEAFGKIGSGNYLRFLVQKSDAGNFKIRMQALRAIKDHGPAGKELLVGLYSSEDVQNKSIIKHVLDERIKA